VSAALDDAIDIVVDAELLAAIAADPCVCGATVELGDRCECGDLVAEVAAAPVIYLRRAA
jgi:predicted ATPase with chaperone activity